MTPERFTQILAFSLAFIGLVACGIGDHYHLTTLANNGGIVIGAGCGILTGQKLQQLTTKGGGDIKNTGDTI